MSTKVNPSLLDNWYFGNLVDQRGGYVVPPGYDYFSAPDVKVGSLSSYATVVKHYNEYYDEISIDGVTYYTLVRDRVRGYIPAWNVYTIDRWTVEADAAGELIVLIEDDGIVLKNVTGKQLQFKQILPADIPISGNTCTISSLVERVESGSIVIGLSQVSSPWANSCATTAITAGGLYSATGVCLQQQQKFVVSISPNTTIKIKAVKLELGTEQTLAHQDSSGKWVLNELPNYADTLMRCQRSCFTTLAYHYFSGAIYGTGSGIFFIPTPTTLRTVPVISVVNSGSIMDKNGYRVDLTANNFNVQINDNAGIKMQLINLPDNLAVGPCTICDFAAKFYAEL